MQVMSRSTGWWHCLIFICSICAGSSQKPGMGSPAGQSSIELMKELAQLPAEVSVMILFVYIHLTDMLGVRFACSRGFVFRYP